MLQIKPFEPVFHLNQQADSIEKIEDGWEVTTSEINIIIEAKCIVLLQVQEVLFQEDLL